MTDLNKKRQGSAPTEDAAYRKAVARRNELIRAGVIDSAWTVTVVYHPYATQKWHWIVAQPNGAWGL